jgi:hypothetical protein
MQKINIFVSKYFIGIIFLLSFAATWALFVPGYFGASDDVHIAWLYEMDYLVKIGQFPPRFVPDLSFGFGYPLFNFVFPLPYYLGEIFHLVGFNLVDSTKIVFGLTIPLSMIGMYLLGKKFTTPIISLSMAVLYGYAPYRALDLYIRGAFGEIVALVFLPWLVWVVCGILDSGASILHRRRLSYLGAIVLAGFILSHNISAYMFLPWLGILALIFVVFDIKSFRINIINLGIMFGVGLVGSSYFWIPALVESRLMKYDTVFKFIDHFPTLRQLVTPYWGYGASVPGPYDGMSFFLGHSSLIVITVGLAVSFLKWKRINNRLKILIGWCMVMLMWSVFMMNFRSSWVWDSIPLIAQFQFPWRFLILVSFGIPLFLLVLGSSKKASIFAIIMVFITLVLNFGYFRPQDFLDRNDQYYMNKYLVYPRVDPLYLTQSEEYLRLPVATTTRPTRIEPFFFGFDGLVSEEMSVNRLDFGARLETSKAAVLSINKYAFPGWEVYLNDRQVKYDSGNPYGQVSLNVPAGAHKIRVIYRETAFRLFFNIASAVALICSFSGFIYTSLKIRKELK